MEKITKPAPLYIRVIKSVSPPTEKLIKEQQNPMLIHTPSKIKKGLIKKVGKSLDVDSSYYLG